MNICPDLYENEIFVFIQLYIVMCLYSVINVMVLFFVVYSSEHNCIHVYYLCIFQNDGPPKARSTWTNDEGTPDNGKRVTKRKITVVGLNQVEDPVQDGKCSQV